MTEHREGGRFTEVEGLETAELMVDGGLESEESSMDK